MGDATTREIRTRPLWRTCSGCMTPFDVTAEGVNETVFHYGPDYEPVREWACKRCRDRIAAASPKGRAT